MHSVNTYYSLTGLKGCFEGVYSGEKGLGILRIEMGQRDRGKTSVFTLARVVFEQ